MNWKKISLVLAVFIVFFVPSVSAAEWTVCSSGCDYTKIQDAVNAADPGDIILVGDGTYTENVYVYKTLTIRSENGSASTIVQAANSNDYIFEVDISSVNITGFTITGATGDSNAGIYLKNADYCTISNNDILNNYNGILLENSSSNTITNNNASSNSLMGIYLESSSNNTIINNNINSNKRAGIELYYSSNNTIINNNANSNTWYGIYLGWDSSSNTITNNNLNNNRYGIYICWDSSSNTITNNNLNNNGDGIHIYWSSSNTITNNNLNLNNWNGIYLFSSPCNLIYHNNFINNINLQVYSNIPGNYFNNSLGEGNYWSDIVTDNLNLTDTDGDGIYDSGSQYPYSKVNDGHVSDYVVDYGPYVDQGNWSSIRTYNIPLISGWNLISTPLQPENTSIKAVLCDLTGRVIVTTYNTTTDGWYIYDTKPSETATLTEMVAGKGYWLYSESDQTLTITGTPPVSPDIDLQPGWNLIGCNYLTPKNISDVLSSCGPIVVLNYNTGGGSWEVYNSTAPVFFLNTFTEMEPGKGYWVSVTSISG